MNKLSLILSAAVITTMMIAGCGGSSYEEVEIGDQVWMTENLNVEKFRNGDPIPHANAISKWRKAGLEEQPAWCYYDNDPANGEKYGKLYNWYAVNDLRGLRPEGWKIPSKEDWKALENYLGDEAETKMKSTTGWEKDSNGTNSSGFSGLPDSAIGTGTIRVKNNFNFVGLGLTALWWSSTGRQETAYYQVIEYDGRGGVSQDLNKLHGLSVSCLRDSDTLTIWSMGEVPSNFFENMKI